MLFIYFIALVNPAPLNLHLTQMVFVTGYSNELPIQRMLMAESLTFDDVLQGNFRDDDVIDGNFVDRVGNPSFKDILGYHWLNQRCTGE